MNSYKIDKSSDHIYFNATLVNKSPVSVPANYNVTMVNSIIENPDEWYLTILRFNIPGHDVPIFVWAPNYYYVSLVYQGQTFTQEVTQQYPEPPPFENYYYTYQAWIDDINYAFNLAFKALIAAFPSAPVASPPIIIFDPSTRLFSFIVPNTYDIVANPSTVQIWLNTYIHFFFESMIMIFASETAQYLNYQIFVQQRIDNVYDSSTTPPLLFISQEIPSLFLWNDLVGLLVTSGTMPVQQEYFPLYGKQISSANSLAIISDFQPLNSNELRSNLVFQYQPSGPYRLIDLFGSSPIRNISFTVFWYDRVQNIYQLLVPPGQTLSLKLLFVKKDLYKSTIK